MARKKAEFKSKAQLSFLGTFFEVTPKDSPRQLAIRKAMLELGVDEHEARIILMKEEREGDKDPYGSR